MSGNQDKNNTVQISESEYNTLKDHSIMLGRIGQYVEDFCGEEDTTLVGVLKLLADYRYLQSIDLENIISLERQKK